MPEYMEYDLDAQTKKPRNTVRTFFLALFILTLSGGLGFIAARGDIVLSDLQGLRDATTRLLPEAPTAAPTPDHDVLLRHISDLETRASLDNALRDEALLQGLDIRVEISQGDVTLNGSVATTDQKAAAEWIATSIVGEGRVDSRIDISDTVDGRTELARRVEFELFATEAFDLSTLDVIAEGGIVTLKGTVQVPAEALLAERLAKEVPGVSQVVNELHLDPRGDSELDAEGVLGPQ